MAIPWFSTFTLITETLVTAGVLYTFYSGYKRGRFPRAVVAVTLGYEILFNISYMAYRTTTHQETGRPDSALHVAVAAFHGIFSLLMFLALLIFFTLAWKNYKRGANYFAIHKMLMKVFIVCWLLAILSGFLFYYEAYFSPEERAVYVAPTLK
ncbi:MAG: hypothetical protein KGJ93_03715 [Patescibacteria group bacterium]|nr:hypothetical protein [Patescibacteria group bacterium]